MQTCKVPEFGLAQAALLTNALNDGAKLLWRARNGSDGEISLAALCEYSHRAEICDLRHKLGL